VPKVRKYMTSDFAVTEEEDTNDPDYTSIGVHGAARTTDKLTKLYLCLDGWKEQADPGRWVDEYFSLQLRHKPACEFAEVGVIRRATEGLLRQKRRERRAIGRIEWVPHIGDKSANARALQGLAEMGLIGIANTAYGDEVLESLIKFPAAKHDDDVDMAALMARVVDEAHPGFVAPPEPEKPKDRWAQKFDEADDDGSWKAA
jgi:phage terminase large subunit-like protein